MAGGARILSQMRLQILGSGVSAELFSGAVMTSKV